MLKIHLRIRPLISATLVLLMILSLHCSGPQPLTVAIDPADETAYVRELNAANMNGRQAFIRWMSQQRKEDETTFLRKDSELSTTHNPFDAHRDYQAVSRGAVIFKHHCARCHGEDAKGRGPASLPDHPAGDFHTFAKRFAATLHRGAPRTWFRKITKGFGEEVSYPDETPGPAMPPFADQLTREQIWLAITYLQSLDVYAREKSNGERHD